MLTADVHNEHDDSERDRLGDFQPSRNHGTRVSAAPCALQRAQRQLGNTGSHPQMPPSVGVGRGGGCGCALLLDAHHKSLEERSDGDAERESDGPEAIADDLSTRVNTHEWTRERLWQRAYNLTSGEQKHDGILWRGTGSAAGRAQRRAQRKRRGTPAVWRHVRGLSVLALWCVCLPALRVGLNVGTSRLPLTRGERAEALGLREGNPRDDHKGNCVHVAHETCERHT